MHVLYCYLPLLETAALPENARRTLTPLVKNWADQLVEMNPKKWAEYGLRPLNAACLMVATTVPETSPMYMLTIVIRHG